jgi:thiol-disulfide isomerase/thioredoxin
MGILKAVLKLVVAAALLYAVALGVLFALMHASNTVAGKALALVPRPLFPYLPLETMWTTARRGTLALGQPAPDFDLPTFDGKSRVRLSALRPKPVVLVFGSYTCPPFRAEVPAVNQVYRDYRDRAQFYFVYLEEAHAHDVWPLPSNERAKIVYATPKDAAARQQIAEVCSRELKIELPMLVDEMSDATGRAYTAWPTRLYVIDGEGRIAWKSRAGPFGFEAALLREALSRVTAEGGPAKTTD